MKKRNHFKVCALLAAALLTSCNDDFVDMPDNPIPTELSGYYVLNSGKMGSNNATLTFYDPTTQETIEDLFEPANGRRLGDTANDMIIYGSKMYIAVYGSQVIEVTDLQGKSIKQIKGSSSQPLQPRAFVSYGGKVYVSLYDGYVASIDTTSLEIDQQVKVGRNPEQLVTANGKLYVANSGGLDYNTPVGYDKTVSVIDLRTFTETQKIETVLNPCNMQINSEEDIFLVSMGNYADIPNTLQKIDTQADTISVITNSNATEMASLGYYIFMMYSQYDENWNQTISYFLYDAINNVKKADLPLGKEVFQPYKIAADKRTNTLFVTESDYTNNGDVFYFDINGKKQGQFEAGLNPIKVLASGTK